jgi:hypothetical protein
MKDFEVFKSGGRNMYAGIFEPGSYSPMALFKDNWNEFLSGWKAIFEMSFPPLHSRGEGARG